MDAIDTVCRHGVSQEVRIENIPEGDKFRIVAHYNECLRCAEELGRCHVLTTFPTAPE